MNKIVIALAFIVIAYAWDYQTEFNNFKAQYGKVYLSSVEESTRREIFSYHLDFVNSWDAKARGFSVAINEYADLSLSEFVSIYNGMNVTRNYDQSLHNERTPSVQGDIVNWVTKGAVTGVKNQGQCGSCWSFSTTGSVEGAHFLAKGQLVSLSEQNLVDCSTPEGNDGCNGGLMDSAFKYIIQNNGIDTEASYPYKSTGPNSCQFKAADVGAIISSYTDVSSGSESALMTAVNQRPVSVAIDASHTSFQLYSSGVYYEPACSATQLDHGVLAVGYGTDGNSDYWYVKNSWGTGWGMKGFIWMSRNKNNNCGIATMASFPVVQGMDEKRKVEQKGCTCNGDDPNYCDNCKKREVVKVEEKRKVEQKGCTCNGDDPNYCDDCKKRTVEKVEKVEQKGCTCNGDDPNYCDNCKKREVVKVEEKRKVEQKGCTCNGDDPNYCDNC
jgi:cathepsin L